MIHHLRERYGETKPDISDADRRRRRDRDPDYIRAINLMENYDETDTGYIADNDTADGYIADNDTADGDIVVLDGDAIDSLFSIYYSDSNNETASIDTVDFVYNRSTDDSNATNIMDCTR